MITENQIAAAVERVARDVPRPDLMLVVATGGIVFAADLLRAMWRHNKDTRVKVVTASSYGDQRLPGQLHLDGFTNLGVEGKCVLVVDDVLDSGGTLKAIIDALRVLGAAQVVTAVVVDKCLSDLRADYYCFKGDIGFLGGYGMDGAGMGRGMPFIKVIE